MVLPVGVPRRFDDVRLRLRSSAPVVACDLELAPAAPNL